MALPKKTYILTGAPCQLDNVNGKVEIVNHSTGEVISLAGRLCKKPSEFADFCDLLNELWSDGFKVGKEQK